MRVLIQHRSRYSYPRPALLGPQLVRLRPADHARARIESYQLVIQPEHRVHWQRDPHGNRVARVTFKAGQTLTALELLVELAVDIKPINPFDFFVDQGAKTIPFRYPDDLAAELAPFLDLSDPAYRLGKRTTELVKTLPTSGDTVDLLVAMNQAVRRDVAYVIRDEPGVWTPEETLVNARGSCRDAAVLLVALMRARGIAARFVSGYLVQLADEGMLPDEPKGVARDVVDLHAWAEAYLPGAGWIGLDGTSGLFAGEGHIPLACTASPGTAAPLEGTSDVGASDVAFATTIQRLGHEIRPTAPYPDDVWDALVTAGDRVDAALTAAQLEVWSGGEPTFVARERQSDDEWQGGAVGPDKWTRGRALASALRDRLAPGGALLHRMGKHYPGESLPRWAIDVIARRDGEPLWLSHKLPDSDRPDDARRLGEELAVALGLEASLHPAFEDPWEVVRAEATLPPAMDPRKAGLDDPEERRRLAKILDQGVGKVVAWVMPLARTPEAAAPAWHTDHWAFRRGHLFLVPGDSPAGLRLPLRSLSPGAAAPEWADGPAQPDPRVVVDVKAATPRADAAMLLPRTALVIEPRAGQQWIFLPPLASFADFCALLAAIEVARLAVGVEVHLEGYAPPPSPQLARFAVTPDPGVLEVNLPPQTSCRELIAIHGTVFELALAHGLTSERYMLDGRAMGSGGGNHITIGGPDAERSPWLQRPDLLASLVTFAQHHPSLAYLFSGMFVGPTSQAPRVDEARHDALYELEIALPALDAKPPAWQVDALLRHLLVDVAGSTHRAEISIDKLYDPATPFGRQGIVELRAFEMPPHPRMVAAQAILVRALVAAFAARPYRHPLVRWGAELHDRFLLPHWLWQDFRNVLDHLAACGVALPAAAFVPFVELRCPLVGTLDLDGATLEIRNAIEPWHVLGEEATATGTARYVDSSVERLELRATGLDEERYLITVNRVALPMRRAGGRDVRVGGVRFRAWAPPHALHPHLGIHHPVRVDVIDIWAQRSVAGGAYHVWHPEGRGYEAAPLTRIEAAARRAQRFTIESASPWPVDITPAAPHPEQPYTLDLRRLDPGTPMPREGEWPTP